MTPYGYHWMLVICDTGAVVNSGFTCEDPPKVGPYQVGKSRLGTFRMEVVEVFTEGRRVKPLDDPHLQQVFGWAIDGAMASGYQNTNPPPEGHWLAPWWRRGRRCRERLFMAIAAATKIDAITPEKAEGCGILVNVSKFERVMLNGLTEEETAATASCAGLSREGSNPKGECPPGPSAEHEEPGPKDAPNKTRGSPPEAQPTPSQPTKEPTP
jgi:hypothetical protein